MFLYLRVRRFVLPFAECKKALPEIRKESTPQLSLQNSDDGQAYPERLPSGPQAFFDPSHDIKANPEKLPHEKHYEHETFMYEHK